MAGFDASKIILRLAVLMFALLFLVKSEETCDIEIENTLRTLLSPQEYPSIQVQALRRDILRRLQEALSKTEDEDPRNYKTPLSSLIGWDNSPQKRNLEALARAGYFRTLPTNDEEQQEEEDDSSNKRSIANLAKNGQLPISNNEGKRGIESLARNGELHRRRQIQDLLDELYSKRNIGSLARNYNFPSYGKRFLGSLAKSGDFPYAAGKRNIASLARDGNRIAGKRNVAALLRQDNYVNGDAGGVQLSNDVGTEMPVSGNDDKRNIASIKAQYPAGKYKRQAENGRSKRQTGDYYGEDDNEEYPSLVYQNQNYFDYEDLTNGLPQAYANSEKRFLGSVAKTGWFRPSNSRYDRYHSPEKRHIGALARLGWLPSFRSIRRFNRSGRSASAEEICREIAANGKTKDNTSAKNSIPLDNKRFLLQPAVDNILLRKILHPRMHQFVTN